MPGLTVAEKLMSRGARETVRAGDVAIVKVDQLLGTDGSAPMAVRLFREMGFTKVASPQRLAFSCDHYAPASNSGIAGLHHEMRTFAAEQGVTVFGVGEGIGHQRMIETGRIVPGTIVAGADSHCVTYGALGALGLGIGSSDLAGAMGTDQLWLRVPKTRRIALSGKLRPDVRAKDVILALLGRIGAEGGNYFALEFHGEGVRHLTVEDRIVISNMATETGAKAALFPVDEATRAYLGAHGVHDFSGAVDSDSDAQFHDTVEIDLSALEPAIALPHNVDRIGDFAAAAGRAVDMVFIGTCTGGRASDIREALSFIRAAGRIAPGVELVITPASQSELELLIADGTLAELVALGGVITPPGCGACCGTSGAIPRENSTVMSSGNRNFKGRMGASSAEIFLASPAACGAAAATGVITDPRTLAK